MAAKVNFFIKTTKDSKDRIYNEDVNIRMRFSNGRSFDMTALTGKQIKPDYWNNEKGIVRQRAAFLESDKFQQDLNLLRNHILKDFNDAPDRSIINSDWLHRSIDKFYNPTKYLQKNFTLFRYIQYFIDNSDIRINPKTGNPVTYKMKREYEVSFNYLQKYSQKYGEPDFGDIDQEFYQQYLEVLRDEGLKPNTVGKKIQTLKIFLNAATELGVNHNYKFKSKLFKTISEETDNIYLTKDEIQQLYEHDFTKDLCYEKVRDVFVVGCWTGLRYSDLHQINMDRVSNELITITQKKTGNKATIPIHPIVNAVLEKYNGKLPQAISNQKFNDYIREAAEEAKINSIVVQNVNLKGEVKEVKYHKHQLIASHTARRSFCTNAYKDGIPTIAIMSISGHKDEKSFLKYIKVSPEEHANMVLEIWKKGLKSSQKKEENMDDYSI